MGNIYHSHNRSEMVPFLPAKFETVLEVGCGEAGFSKNLTNLRLLSYWGVEIDPLSAEAAKKLLSEVLVGDFDAVQEKIPKNYFDLVVCNDVIEHFCDHESFLQDIKNYMKPGACLVGSIPNVRHVSHLYELLVKKDWEYKPAGILDRTHMRFFTEVSWKRSLETAGFEILKLEGINSLLMFESRKEKRIQKIMRSFLGRDTAFLQFGFCAKLK